MICFTGLTIGFPVLPSPGQSNASIRFNSIRIGLIYFSGRRKCSSNPRRLAQTVKFPLIPFLLMASFVTFNFVPDLVFVFRRDDTTYHVMCVLWTTGYIIDPVLYIFSGRQTRTIAKTTLSRTFKFR